MIRCNEEGIPKLVQSINYNTELMYEFKLFNGNLVTIDVGRTLPIGVKPDDDEVIFDLENEFLAHVRPQVFPKQYDFINHSLTAD